MLLQCVLFNLQKSSLEFKLHRLAYINLVNEGPHRTAQAIAYARQNLAAFVDQHQRGIISVLNKKITLVVHFFL